MTKLAIRNVEYDSVCDLGPVSIAWQEDKLRVAIDEFFDEPRASDPIHFNFLAGDPFHKLEFVCGSLVLVCGPGRCALRRASNLYPSRGRAHRRRSWRFHCRSQRCIVDPDLFGDSLVRRKMEPKIGEAGFDYSLLTGICVGIGTIAFFLLFQ